MIYKFNFRFEVVRQDGIEMDEPYFLAVSFDKEMADLIRRRTKLVAEIEKVDPRVSEIIFKEDSPNVRMAYINADDMFTPSGDSVNIAVNITRYGFHWSVGHPEHSSPLETDFFGLDSLDGFAEAPVAYEMDVE